MKCLLLIFLALCVVSCAGIKPPPGGSEDMTPPTIDTTMPANGTLNVPLDAKIHIYFKQNVDRQSLMSSVSMTPYINGVVKFDWSGYDEVTLNLPEKLRDNTTYVLTFGKDLKTRRAGKLTTPIQIIFSTGSSIDSGSITGSVLPSFQSTSNEINNNLFVFAYDLTNIVADTIDYAKNKPDFLVQPSTDGKFEFKALKVGHTYRVLAVQDEFRNKLYDHSVDNYGITKKDIALTSQVVTNVTIRMGMKADTSKPALQDAEVIDIHHLKVSFNKPIDSASVKAGHFLLLDEKENLESKFISAYRDNIEKKPGVITLVTSDAIKPLTNYLLRANTISDERGNPLSDSGSTLRFTSAEKIIDTSAPLRFGGFGIGDSTGDNDPLLNIKLSVIDALNLENLTSALQLKDSTGKKLPITIIPTDDAHFLVRSRDTLTPKMKYTLSLDNKGFVSILGSGSRPVKDTTFLIRFWVRDIEESGTITGEVIFNDAEYSPKDHQIVVELVNINTGEKTKKVLGEGEKQFSFSRLLRGKYRIHAYLTKKNSDRFDAGNMQPFRFALPSGDYPDEIDVRPRWTVDKVNVDLK